MADSPTRDRQNRLVGAFRATKTHLIRLLPVDRAAKKVVELFSVSDDRVAEILAEVRSRLPTTEALFIGKPQAGKSSIVRGLTGVSREIVGQGFRPHTQHTERYAYPSEDLPLLVFTDTVGLGDIGQDTDAIVAELTDDLQGENRHARILILTVKINDFAIASLRNITEKLRQLDTLIPCLLVFTCLHFVYPPDEEYPPTYPPSLVNCDRPSRALQEAFNGLCDRAVAIDFTLEEDGYTPVFYGLEALRDAVADLLPEAEARTIYQLLDETGGKELGDLYRDVGRRYVTAFAAIAATLAAVPLPFATMPVLTALQVSMVGILGQLYGQTLTIFEFKIQNSKFKK